MNSKIIAVDFDGTLCENKWPEIGKSNEEVIEYLKNRQRSGDKIILWTCRTGDLLDKAVLWCSEQGLIFNAVNENLPETLEWMGGDKVEINRYFKDAPKGCDEIDKSEYDQRKEAANESKCISTRNEK